LRGKLHLFRIRGVFYREQLAVAFGYGDAGGVHVGVEDVGAGLGKLHEALVDGGGVGSLVHVFGVTGVGGVRRLSGLERREAWASGRKQIPRCTRNDKRGGGGRGGGSLCSGWRSGKSIAKANTRTFDSAHDDRVRSGTDRWTPAAASRGSVA
jgi:hypothetical protein